MAISQRPGNKLILFLLVLVASFEASFQDICIKRAISHRHDFLKIYFTYVEYGDISPRDLLKVAEDIGVMFNRDPPCTYILQSPVNIESFSIECEYNGIVSTVPPVEYLTSLPKRVANQPNPNQCLPTLSACLCCIVTIICSGHDLCVALPRGRHQLKRLPLRRLRASF